MKIESDHSFDFSVFKCGKVHLVVTIFQYIPIQLFVIILIHGLLISLVCYVF